MTTRIRPRWPQWRSGERRAPIHFPRPRPGFRDGRSTARPATERRGRRLPSAGELEIGVSEVVAEGKQRLVGQASGGVRQAIAEVQACGMAALAVPTTAELSTITRPRDRNRGPLHVRLALAACHERRPGSAATAPPPGSGEPALHGPVVVFDA